MTPLYPIVFHPIFKERVWGGRTLEVLYGKALPPGVPIGESWEITDRPGDESIIANGALAGRTLRWLMESHGRDVLGEARPAGDGQFPLLCKILDAREKLSLQVHPPESAATLGDPKTEMWYIAGADTDAELYVGLKRGITREQFEDALQRGSVADCFHRIRVHAGDTMFLPSGRVHAIGAGLLIFEIQQNSDTTFRVFDWNRTGLDGKPRALHVAESLASIDFSDVEPALVDSAVSVAGQFGVRALVRNPLFNADLIHATSSAVMTLDPPHLRVIAQVHGRGTIRAGGEAVTLRPGDFCLLPAVLDAPSLKAEDGGAFLVVDAGH